MPTAKQTITEMKRSHEHNLINWFTWSDNKIRDSSYISHVLIPTVDAGDLTSGNGSDF